MARVLVLVENESVPSDRHVWNECRALRRAGHEVEVVCPTGPGRDGAAHERREGVEINRYRPRPAGDGVAGYAREYAWALASTARLARRVAARGPVDVVHACSPPDVLLLAALPLRRQGARFLFDHHDLTPELCRSRFGGGALHRAALAAEQLAFRAADIVLSVNEPYRRVAIERGRRDPADVFVVRTGPDLGRFRPAPPRPRRPRGDRHLLAYVGVMNSQDGVDEALLALRELGERRGDWRAVFMGDGEALPGLRRLSASLGLAGRVEFTGWVDQEAVRDGLAAADVCLAPEPLTPLNDVSSLVKLAEYMAVARPFVAYDLAESRRAAGPAGAYARPGDRAGFARLVSELLDDPSRRAAMGAEGRRRVERSLAWEHQERALLAAYSRLLALGPARESVPAALARLLRYPAANGNPSGA